MARPNTLADPRPTTPGRGHRGGAGAAEGQAGALSLEELRQLASAVTPIGPDEIPADRLEEAHAFNGVVARFRELVVAARNQAVQGHPIPAGLGFELRALSEALPGERRRATGPAPPGPEGFTDGPLQEPPPSR